MANKYYERGSEWRKWDLHIHTPFSHLQNNFDVTFENYAKRLIESAQTENVAVVGITDYFTIQGYQKLIHLLDDEESAIGLLGQESYRYSKSLTFFPNIELRSSTIISSSQGQDSRVNYHILFSDEVSCDDIENHFLREIKFFNETAPGQDDEKWPLTIENLETLGARLKNEHPQFTGTDIKVGMMNACIDPAQAIKALNSKPSKFSNRFLVFIPIDEDLSRISWNGQGHLTRKSYIQKSHCIFSSNKGTRDFALGKKANSMDEYLSEFKSLRPCFHSSDAHSITNLFEPLDPDGNPSRLYTWVKADPTFQGLLQTLVEPEFRVHIGQEPPNAERIRTNQTKYINSVSIKPSLDSRTNEKWFNQDIIFNTGLNCIIGNKGSGKSALSDVLGLLGNTYREDKFSFLNTKKFRDRRQGKSEHFEASLIWLNDELIGPKKLNESIEPSGQERVRYIPQNFLEDLCNELVEGDKSQFYIELEKVIFSHIPEDQKLGKESLTELLSYLSDEKKESIEIKKDKLSDLNHQIESLEKECREENINKILSLINSLRNELKTHDSENVKPKEVKPPENDDSIQEAIDAQTQMISEKNNALEKIDNAISSTNVKLKKFNEKIAVSQRLFDKIQNFESTLKNFFKDSTGDATTLDIDMKSIVDVKIDLKPIQDATQKIEENKKKILPLVDPINDDGLIKKRNTLAQEISTIKEKLSEPQRKYQKYIDDIKKWEKQRKRIIGDDKTPGSLTYESKRLERIQNDNPKQIEKLKSERLELASQIYNKKEEIKNIYEEHYKAVTDFLKSDDVPQGDMFRLAFDVAIKESGFETSFLDFIHKGKIGSFHGDSSGSKQLREIMECTDFDDKNSVISFIAMIDEHLHYDMRDPHRPKIDVFSQLKEKINLKEVYNVLFGLDYIGPEYHLTWGEKEISQLSPGERGTLLLIFYLCIDRDNIPLIVDQPEENLDNQTVFDVLVPSIQKAKDRRQIIIVTHNPNLAVVCDAEQIICATFFKEDGNRIQYNSGSIENPVMNRAIVDILEGTKPAFNNREQKYKNCEQ